MKDILSQNLTGDFQIFDDTNESFTYDCLLCGNCCQNITVIVDPFDMVPLAEALGKQTSVIMKEHLGITQEDKTGWPFAFLKSAQTGRCEFNVSNKCSLWQSRPKVCRLFPLGMASTIKGETQKTLFYLLKRTHACKGFKEKKVHIVNEWLQDSGLNPYIDNYKDFTAIKYELLAKFDFNALDQGRVMLLAMVMYDFDTLFTFFPNLPYVDLYTKYSAALSLLPWLVKEITPDKTGNYLGGTLTPNMPRELFFFEIGRKLQDILK